MWNFKRTHWNSTQNILPIHWKIWYFLVACILYTICCKELEIQLKYTKYTLMTLLVCVTVIHSCRRVGIMPLNASLPGQNGHHFTDDSFKYIFMNEKFCILIWISLKLVPYGLIDNKSVLVHVMAWYQTSDKPLPKPMMTQFTDVYMWH